MEVRPICYLDNRIRSFWGTPVTTLIFFLFDQFIWYCCGKRLFGFLTGTGVYSIPGCHYLLPNGQSELSFTYRVSFIEFGSSQINVSRNNIPHPSHIPLIFLSRPWVPIIVCPIEREIRVYLNPSFRLLGPSHISSIDFPSYWSTFPLPVRIPLEYLISLYVKVWRRKEVTGRTQRATGLGFPFVFPILSQLY